MVDKTVSAMSERVGRSFQETRRTLYGLEGRRPALVRRMFDAGLDLEIWTTTDNAAAAMSRQS